MFRESSNGECSGFLARVLWRSEPGANIHCDCRLFWYFNSRKCFFIDGIEKKIQLLNNMTDLIRFKKFRLWLECWFGFEYKLTKLDLSLLYRILENVKDWIQISSSKLKVIRIYLWDIEVHSLSFLETPCRLIYQTF